MALPPRQPRPKLNFGSIGGGGGGPPGELNMNNRKKNLGLDFGNMLKDDEKKRSETDQKFEEIINRSGMITINGRVYKTDIDEDMQHKSELGNGTSGHVVRMCHKPSNYVIAVKQMRRSGNPDENKRIIMDLEVVLQSDCPYIVQCLGYFITAADVWICMEMMQTCMDKLLKRLDKPIPENILGKVAMATVRALNYLKEKHGVIHRDVKPSNILLDEKGNVKLCDFGISGRLVDSKAKTRSAGCTGYMAPERIDPPDLKNPNYDIRADVWSLGITLVELATGKFPYGDCHTDFEVMTKILNDAPPSLPADMNFSDEFRSFVNLCLRKNFKERPKYKELLDHPFIKKSERSAVDVRTWYNLVLPQQRHPGFSNSLSFQSNIGRHSGRMLRSSTAGSPSPSGSNSFVTTPGSRPSRYEEFSLPSPNLRTPTPSTPGTPSPNTSIPPEPPPRYSRMSSGSDGLRTPTNSSSSSSGNNLTSPSPTSVSISSPSPDGPPPPIRRKIYFGRCRF